MELLTIQSWAITFWCMPELVNPTRVERIFPALLWRKDSKDSHSVNASRQLDDPSTSYLQFHGVHLFRINAECEHPTQQNWYSKTAKFQLRI